MWAKIKALYRKYREIILYLIFGGLTTAVNVAVYYGVYELLRALLRSSNLSDTAARGVSVNVGNVIAFIASVLFAYVTNRRYVFRSATKGRAARVEFLSFVAARLVTLGLDEADMNIFVVWLGMPNLLIKILSNIFVIIVNYVFSKFIVFRKREKGKEA